MEKLSEFLSKIRSGLENDEFVRLTISKPADKHSELRKVIFKLAEIKKVLMLSAIYRYPTKDITKNFSIEEGLKIVFGLLEQDFQIATYFSVKHDFVFRRSKSSEVILVQNPSFEVLPAKTHDKEKKRLVSETSYLIELGVLDQRGNVKKGKGDKLKQIQKFVEIVDSLLQKGNMLDHDKTLKVLDMGSGKGYLTFALYEYLNIHKKQHAHIVGVEAREDLVKLCNDISTKVGFENLHFEEGFISDYKIEGANILIALHACNTATDDAIFKGIQAGSDLIICAPCCHKQIRKQMNAQFPLSKITDFGILKERQAEMLTDTIRALLLEYAGYKARVFEFISSEHTGKNVMVVGQKHEGPVDKEKILEEIKSLKETFGVEWHYLEKLILN